MNGNKQRIGAAERQQAIVQSSDSGGLRLFTKKVKDAQ
jgi:hypothetical protein